MVNFEIVETEDLYPRILYHVRRYIFFFSQQYRKANKLYYIYIRKFSVAEIEHLVSHPIARFTSYSWHF